MPLPEISPLDIYTNTRREPGFLLESMEGSEKLARYSFIGIEPEFIITIGDTVCLRGNEPFVSIARDPEGKDPVEKVRSVLSRFHYMNVKAPRFFGGLVGYFAYDCVYSLFEKVRGGKNSPNGKGVDGPDASFMFTKDCIVIDHKDRKLYLFSSPFLTYDTDITREYNTCAGRIRILADQISSLAGREEILPGTSAGSSGCTPFISGLSQCAFEQAVGRIKEHIAAGDIFQAVLSRRMQCDIGQDPFTVHVLP